MSTRNRLAGHSSAARSERLQRTRYRTTSLVLVGALVVVAAVLGVANATQGPRLSSAEINPQLVVDRPGGRLFLHSNQPLASVNEDQLTISPSIGAELSLDGNTVAIRFDGILDYNTTYSVAVNDAVGAFTGAIGRLAFEFTTPDVAVYSLQRNSAQDGASDGTPDRVLRHNLSGSESNEVVFEAPRIQEYAIIDRVLAAIVLDEEDNSSLVVSTLADGLTSPIDTPDAANIRQLRASESAGLLGFVADTAPAADPADPAEDAANDAAAGAGSDTLFLYDFAGSGLAVPVTGLDGSALPVIAWAFVPGTSSLVAQSIDQQLYLIDPLLGAAPVPLGSHAELRGFLPGTQQLVVADPLSGSIIDLAAGSATEVVLAEPEVDPDLFPGKLVLLGEDRYLQHFVSLDESSGVGSVLLLTDDDGTREIYRPASSESRIGDYCVSPNGQYAAVEVISGDSEPDAYPVRGGFTGTSTYFVDIDTGTTSRGVPGFLADWCA